MANADNFDKEVKLARALALSGEYKDWRAVKARLTELVSPSTTELFADRNVCDAIDAICMARRASQKISDVK